LSDFDVAIVGGGLHGCTIALALAHAHAGARVVVIERAPALGGNHTWCFHADDVPPALTGVIAPAVAHRWDGYDVAFPAAARTIGSPYAAVTSASLDRAVRAAFASRAAFELATSRCVREVAGDHVVLDDGAVVRADLVIDARGPQRYAPAGACGYQKFVGLELALARPHGLTRPILIDTRVPQLDGLRFLYVLPLAAHRLLVEDTYFSDDRALDEPALAARALAYARAAGYAPAEIVRTETGVLPMPHVATALEPGAPGVAPVLAGYQGGWFHPTTGYSFPLALRVAAALAHDLALGAHWRATVADHAAQLAFATRLNRMMFRWFAPADRHHLFAHFYRMPEAAIRRFYALRTTRADRARMFLGRPPRGMSWRAALLGGSPS
jgi:lycopene beta-cyclase